MQFSERSLATALKVAGVHEKAISEFFPNRTSFSGDAPVFETPLRVMAFTNRCGSNLLADYLRQTCKIGGFHESINYDSVRETAEKSGLKNFPDYIKYIFEKLSVNDNFGVKASVDQTVMLGRWNIPGMFAHLQIVHIRRADVVSQAISHWIAYQTNKWTSNQAGNNIEAVYDFQRIDKIIEGINNANSIIPLVARALGAETFEVRYEDLVKDPVGTITAVGTAISLDMLGWFPSEPKIARQADGINQEFSERYISDLNAAIR